MSGTFIFAPDGECPDGYDIYKITNDYVKPMVTDAILCPDGQYMVSGTCKSYGKGNCPDGLYNAIVSSDVIVAPSEDTCPNGYENYEIIDTVCDSYGFAVTDDIKTCVIMCDGGVYTELGTCGSLCGHGAQSFNIKNGTGETYKYPIYSEKQIAPSLNVGFGENVCYVNLLPGTGRGTLNIRTEDGKSYHVVK